MRPRLMLYESASGGHRAEHLCWLADAWIGRDRDDVLVLVPPQQLADDFPEVAARADASGGRIRLAPYDSALEQGTQWDSLLGTRRAEPLARAIQAHRPERVLAMSFDHFLAPLGWGVPLPADALVSGIFFRPTLHYDAIGSPSTSLRERAERTLKRLLTRRALRHPAFDTLFSLDPTAVPALQALGPNVALLPDPVPEEPVLRPRKEVRADLSIDPGRTLFVLAGGLDDRKGPLETLRALLALAPEAQPRTAVAFMGRVGADVRDRFDALADEVRGSTAVQLVVRDAFVPTGEMQTVVAAADVLLVPYVKHVGSSGFLMRAAGAGVPVLSQAWGAMGYLVREHGLGQTVDPTDTRALATSLSRASQTPEAGFDSEGAARFAARFTVQAYTETILNRLAP